MRKYIIERELPAVGSLEREQLKEAVATSNAALAQLAPDVQWPATKPFASTSPRTRT